MLFQDKYVVYDIETSGFNSKTDVITQISAIRVVDGKKSNNLFNVFIKSGVPIPVQVQELTGITNEVLDMFGVSLQQAMSAFRAYVGTDCLIAHNGKRFDSKFIEAAGESTGIYINNQQEDSMVLAKEVLPGLKSYSLASLVSYFDIQKRDAHRAQNDVLMLADVTEKLLEIKREQTGQTVLF